MKKHLLLSEDTLEGKQNTAVMCMTEGKNEFLIKMTQEKKKHTLFAFDFKPTYMIAPESVASEAKIFGCPIKRLQDLNPSSLQRQKIVIIDAQNMNTLSNTVLETLCKTEFVLTSDELNLSKFLTSLRKKILLTNSNIDAKTACYMVIPKDDFARLNKIFESTFEENLEQMTKITTNAD